MKRISLGIIANTGKPEVGEVLPDFLRWLSDEGICYTVASDLAPLIDLKEMNTALPEDIAKKSDFVLSFGGDGTFLQTARLVAPLQVPIFGINMGEFGYLAEVPVEDMRQRVKDLLEGNFLEQERMMLQVNVTGDKSGEVHLSLNDVVIERGGSARIIRLDTSIDGEYLNTFNADGLIIATSTGSTGYSLSSGGPILEPCIHGIIINPISPHMLANRPLVVSDNRQIEISTFSHSGSFQVSVDGQKVWELESNSSLTIKRASCITRVVIFRDFSFNKLLRNKLHWRDRMHGEPIA
ncbi:MAG: NAD(+) kinase [Calditrichaeota bacterium]|jgi:NAD+ kinase|nr:NAD(+) kinase [Calditrichota bacterium]MBT7619164.1 NAD(+) kinase [Calditrichota bacterium]MBT7790220.1 NAD(+) kinase [Calditrichota bacterium]